MKKTTTTGISCAALMLAALFTGSVSAVSTTDTAANTIPTSTVTTSASAATTDTSAATTDVSAATTSASAATTDTSAATTDVSAATTSASAATTDTSAATTSASAVPADISTPDPAPEIRQEIYLPGNVRGALVKFTRGRIAAQETSEVPASQRTAVAGAISLKNDISDNVRQLNNIYARMSELSFNTVLLTASERQYSSAGSAEGLNVYFTLDENSRDDYLKAAVDRAQLNNFNTQVIIDLDTFIDTGSGAKNGGAGINKAALDRVISDLHKFAAKYKPNGIILNIDCLFERRMFTYEQYMREGGGIGYDNWVNDGRVMFVRTAFDIIRATNNRIGLGLLATPRISGFDLQYADYIYLGTNIDDTGAANWNAACKAAHKPMYSIMNSGGIGNKDVPVDMLLREVITRGTLPANNGYLFTDLTALFADTRGITNSLVNYFNDKISTEGLFGDLTMTSPAETEFITNEPYADFAGRYDPNFELLLNGHKVELQNNGEFYFRQKLSAGVNHVKLVHKDTESEFIIERKISPVIQAQSAVRKDGSIEITALCYGGSKVNAVVSAAAPAVRESDTADTDIVTPDTAESAVVPLSVAGSAVVPLSTAGSTVVPLSTAGSTVITSSEAGNAAVSPNEVIPPPQITAYEEFEMLPMEYSDITAERNTAYQMYKCILTVPQFAEAAADNRLSIEVFATTPAVSVTNVGAGFASARDVSAPAIPEVPDTPVAASAREVRASMMCDIFAKGEYTPELRLPAQFEPDITTTPAADTSADEPSDTAPPLPGAVSETAATTVLSEEPTQLPLYRRTVRIETAYDSKAAGYVREREFTAAYGAMLAGQLQHLGANVLLDPLNQVSYVTNAANAADAANAANAEIESADIVITLRTNRVYDAIGTAPSPEMRGMAVYYANAESAKLAENICRRLSEGYVKFGGGNAAATTENPLNGNKYNLPSVVISLGYISNKADSEYLTNSKQRLDSAARAAAGVAEYFAEYKGG